MISLILKLSIAHLVGDFVLQPDKWVKDKKEKKWKSRYLYCHVVVHLILNIILLKFESSYSGLILILGILHYFIDLGKLYLEDSNEVDPNRTLFGFRIIPNARVLFFLDQIAHFIVIGLLVFWYEPYSIDFKLIY